MNISPSWPGTYLHEYCYGFLHIATDTVLAQSKWQMIFRCNTVVRGFRSPNSQNQSWQCQDFECLGIGSPFLREGPIKINQLFLGPFPKLWVLA